jgi:hypothetical protein
VKIRISSLSLSFLASLALAVGMISWGSTLNAQTTPSTPSQTQQPETQATPDSPPTQQTPQTQHAPDQTQTPDQAQTPDSKTTTPNATAPSATDSQSFLGTVVKSGDKYVLKDDAGKTYDIDHQDDVKKFEGKRVKVQGTLDATGTKIAVK